MVNKIFAVFSVIVVIVVTVFTANMVIDNNKRFHRATTTNRMVAQTHYGQFWLKNCSYVVYSEYEYICKREESKFLRYYESNIPRRWIALPGHEVK